MNDAEIQAVLSAVDKNFTSAMQAAVEALGEVSQKNAELQAKSNSTSSSVSSDSNRMTGGFLQMASALGAVAIASKAFQMISSGISGAVTRMDTLNNATRTFQNMGFNNSQITSAMDGIKQSIQGLPTPLDESVKGVQMLAASTNDLGTSQKVYGALNDAIIGFGGNTEMVNNAIVQLSQAFANGKVDAQTWNSMMQSNLGPTLNAIARQMGITTSQLKDGLSTGKISVQDFENALISLDQNGGGGLKSLHKIALDATNGIGTSMQNAKTAMVRGLADVLTAINKGLTDNGLPSLAQMISDAGSTMERAFSRIAKAIPPVIAAIAPFLRSLGPMAPVLKAVAAGFVGLGVIAMISSKIAPAITVFGALNSSVKGIASGIGGLISKLNPFSSAGKAAGEALNDTASGAKGVGESAPQAATGASALAKNIALIGAGVGAAALGMGILVLSITKLAATGSAGASALLGVTASMTVLIGVLAMAGSFLGEIGPQAAIAYAGMAVLVASFALLTAAVTAFASTGGQGLVALAAMTASIIAITAVMAALSSVMTAGAVGLIAFGAAVLMVGAGIGLATAGIALLITAFNNLNTSGTTIIATLTAIGQGFAMMITGFVTTLATQIPIITTALMQMITGFLTALASAIPQIITAATQIVVAFVEGIAANLGQVITAALDLLQAFVDGIGQNMPRIIDIAMQAVMYFVYGVGYALGQVISSGWKLIVLFAQGIMKGLGLSKNGGFSNAKSVVSGLKSVSLVDVGSWMIHGLVNGLVGMAKEAYAAAATIANNIKSKIQSALKIHSPSRVMRDEVGVYIPAGIAVGMLSNLNAVTSAANQLAQAAIVSVPAMDTRNFDSSMNAINAKMDNMGMSVDGTLSANNIIDNTSSRSFEAKMTELITNAVQKLDNVDQRPVVTVDTMNRMRQYNEKVGAQAYVMLKGGM